MKWGMVEEDELSYLEAVDKVRETGGSGMIISEILCLFSHIFFSLFLLPLEWWSLPQINYMVTSIGVDLNRMTTGLDSGYWKIKFSEASWKKAQFWGVNNKLTWTKMPMRVLNASLVFKAIIPDLIK